ncbi:MAG: adenylate/guanylate cyclase domain-containing protein [Cyclobacteriaceae bacterium]
MTVSPAHRRNLLKIVTFSTLWGLGGIIFTLVERGVIGGMKAYPSTGVAYEFMNNLISIPIATFVGGFILIGIDILVINKRVQDKSFTSILLIKGISFLIIILTTTTFAGVFATSATLGRYPFHPDVIAGVSEFFDNFAFWSIIIYAGFLNVLFLFMIEVSDNLGTSVFWNFFSGKYHKPKVEQRVFMFLDLKGSTYLAEKLGHQTYYEFLNRFFEDVSSAVLSTWGEIYQYVCDAVVIHWPWDKAESSIVCFFKIKQKIDSERTAYTEHFGITPEFRVGIHGGLVSIGEIGALKKDILYIGDVLNATSRIQEICKKQGERNFSIGRHT